MTKPTIDLRPCPFCGGKASKLLDTGVNKILCKICNIELSPNERMTKSEAKGFDIYKVWNSRDHLIASQQNTLPLDEVPEVYDIKLDRMDGIWSASIYTKHQVEKYVCMRETAPEALRAAIEKVLP